MKIALSYYAHLVTHNQLSKSIYELKPYEYMYQPLNAMERWSSKASEFLFVDTSTGNILEQFCNQIGFGMGKIDSRASRVNKSFPRARIECLRLANKLSGLDHDLSRSLGRLAGEYGIGKLLPNSLDLEVLKTNLDQASPVYKSRQESLKIDLPKMFFADPIDVFEGIDNGSARELHNCDQQINFLIDKIDFLKRVVSNKEKVIAHRDAVIRGLK